MQEYSSANTCVNVINLVFKKTEFEPYSNILDYGGGRYDSNKQYLNYKDSTLTLDIYDPYNRTQEHNKKILQKYNVIRPDYIVCSNVLNVLKDNEDILNVLRNVAKLSGPNTKQIFAIYEGSGTLRGKETKPNCWQRNEKAICYAPVLKLFFKTVEQNGKLFYCGGKYENCI